MAADSLAAGNAEAGWRKVAVTGPPRDATCRSVDRLSGQNPAFAAASATVQQNEPCPCLAADEAAIRSRPPCTFSRCFNRDEQGGCRQNDSLADGCPCPRSKKTPRARAASAAVITPVPASSARQSPPAAGWKQWVLWRATDVLRGRGELSRGQDSRRRDCHCTAPPPSQNDSLADG